MNKIINGIKSKFAAFRRDIHEDITPNRQLTAEQKNQNEEG